ncbi:sulfotransferase, partial [Candidatus Bipolaricaulota bacterium]
MTQPTRPTNAEHPVALGSFRSWMRLLRSAKGIDRAFLPRAAFVTCTTLLTAPLRAWEHLRHGNAVRRTAIHPSPVFIVGHWRSGTTHLQNLLCQDDNLGSLTTFQALAPGFCLIGNGWIKRSIARFTAAHYPTRLIDSIPLDMDAPQEDEFGLANLSEHSFIHTFSFPRQAGAIFERSVLLEGLTPSERTRWVDAYLSLLRKATFASGGRRQLIKNCAHSARIPLLLEHFPDAKFIHIHRNPYKVFLSTLHMLNTVLLRSQLQRVSPDRLEAFVLRSYVQLYERFLADRSLIPEGNYAELRFDDLQAAPMDQLRRIYEELDLPGFVVAEPRLRTYLESVAGYKKNPYDLDPDVIERVNR